MEARLTDVVERALEVDAEISDEAELGVLAACVGPGALDELLDSERPAAKPPSTDRTAVPVGAYVASVAVKGFRGVGGKATLEVAPGPGLTLVVGRNGSGKSSFAEALELLLTGSNSRWDGDRSVIWKEGWRNLHDGDEVEIEAGLLLEGRKGAVRVTQHWAQGEALAGGQVTVSQPGKGAEGREALGWDEAIKTFRPFLSHNELGSAFSAGPTALFDAMSRILGLDDLVDARALLRGRRMDRDKLINAADKERTGITAALGGSDDQRSAEALKAIGGRTWDLAALERLLAGDGGSEDDELQALRRLAAFNWPDAAQVVEKADALEAAAAAERDVAATDAGQAMRVAGILERAIDLHAHTPNTPCPVCAQGRLDDEWLSNARTELERLKTEAEAAQRAHSELRQRTDEARLLLNVRLPAFAIQGLDGTAARRATELWNEGAGLTDPLTLVVHLRTQHTGLDGALSQLRDAAAAEMARRDDAWRPLAQQLSAWLPSARVAIAARTQVAWLAEAEKWLGTTTDALRAERFDPIADQARQTWNELRQGSSVELDKIELEGAGPRRHLAMDVTIDGVDGAALAVMSQGELNSLALSLFLPRATSAESPFRFIVIDDPVQAMDPAKVDGLARVFQKAAESRQVIVFTHDDRLPEAVRRLRIPARVVQVTRRLQSAVEVRSIGDPLERYFEDARALLLTEGLDPRVPKRVIPGLCRSAIEFACTERTRGRQLASGRRHDEIEVALAGAKSLNERLALALFDDASNTAEVRARLDRDVGKGTGELVQALNRGVHEGGFDGPGFVQRAEKLAKRLREP